MSMTKGSYLRALIPVLLALQAVWAPAQGAENPSPLPQKSLDPMLKIEWGRGPNLPQGFQDSDGGVLGNHLITVGGFCSGGLERDNREKPGVYPRGFLRKGWALDLSGPGGWQLLPDFPGDPRQGLSAAKVGESLYFWGGFSYSDPFCYSDGFQLSRDAGVWRWEPLPPFPWPFTSAALVTIGTRIYATGGADFNAEAFFTDSDRHGKIERLGSRLLVLDTQRLEAGWKELPPCPGTPRWVHAGATVEGNIYVLGGATGNMVREGTNYGYCTVVDNWTFDPAKAEWTRLRDLPISSGNFPRSTNAVYQGRYILLPGGHQYGSVLNPDGTVTAAYGKASQARPESGLHNDVFVYDTQTDLFGSADKLPLDNNLPMTVIRDDEIFLLGGETGGGVVEGEYYGHHPDLFLKGKIRAIEHPPQP